jgi:lysyl-tRNA synthetase class I
MSEPTTFPITARVSHCPKCGRIEKNIVIQRVKFDYICLCGHDKMVYGMPSNDPHPPQKRKTA